VDTAQDSMTMETVQKELNAAILYALREGCFHPVPKPRGLSVRDWVQWGAMVNLHRAIRAFDLAGWFEKRGE
jgi:hypothetical protein